MSDADIEQVRAFNRTVTQRIGALHDQYLARGHPLGASRVLWEIEPDGTDIRVIRSRLELDSGYLSRLLRRLEHEDLVEIVPSSSDRRVRLARLTDAGHAERDELDRQSDALAESLLAALDDRRRARLVDAMATVDRLLTAGRVTVGVESPTSPDARRCIEAYFHELDTRFEAGFDPASSISADAHELVEPAGLLLLARLGDEAVGCGALKLHGESPAEIKRMWVSPRARGLGVGRRLLDELELAAHARGATEVRLETNRSLGEAIELYRSSGYLEVPAFNDEPYAHHWFEKRL
jgi:DNA-binding MarR family transcriptional regulator/GNAT superfamily N-acetyltransferase